MILSCYVDDDTLRRLQIVSAETGREIEELAEAAIAETAIKAHRCRGGEAWMGSAAACWRRNDNCRCRNGK